MTKVGRANYYDAHYFASPQWNALVEWVQAQLATSRTKGTPKTNHIQNRVKLNNRRRVSV